jgi:hypothetical protein
MGSPLCESPTDFIKLTSPSNDAVYYIHWKLISSLTRVSYTIVKTIYNEQYNVKETPEEIFALIEKAEDA